MFPHRISWLRAIALILSRIFTALLFLPLLNNEEIKASPIEFVRFMAFIYSYYIWVFSAFFMGVGSHLNFVFRGETKLWKFRRESVWEAVNALKISFSSDLVGVGFFVAGAVPILHFFAPVKLDTKAEAETAQLVILGLLILLLIVATFFVWFFSIPVLYQQKLKVAKPQVKARTKPPTTPTKSTKPKPK